MNLFSVCLITAVICSFGFSQTPAPGESFNRAVRNGAWCWYQDPRAIYHKGSSEKTYIGFIDTRGSIGVWSYDHETGQTDSVMLHTSFEKDDHDAPTLFLRKNGRITSYYTRHGTDHYIFHRTTVNPEDISAWQPEDTIITPRTVNGTCYTHEFQLTQENDRIYLFTRNLGYGPTMIYSDDEGNNWSAPRQVVTSGDRPYTKYVSDGESRVHFAFTDGHPRVQPSNSIYYMYMESGKFFKASGIFIKDTAALPVKTGSSYEADRIYNGATNGKAWIWDIALDAGKNPVLVFAVFPNDNNHHYYYARWTGTQWFTKDLVNAGKWFPQTPGGANEPEPNYSPGISLDHGNPSILYLSRFLDGQCEIERWVTDDSGKTWTSTAITESSTKRNVRPIVAWPQPYGAESPAKKLLFWMNGDYVHYTNYSTGIRYTILTEEVAAFSRSAAVHPERLTGGGAELFSISGKRLGPVDGNPVLPLGARLPAGVFLVRKAGKVYKVETSSGHLERR